jgi:large repetitive protein
MKQKLLLVIFLGVLFSIGVKQASSQTQSGLCDPNVPFFFADLSSSPSATWTSSPPVVRQGNCCGTSNPDRCIEFSILLHPDAVAINFNIASGAIPPGAMFYQIGCGPPTPVGTPLCLNGPGPYTLTFCKPGNNQNTYTVTSIMGPQTAPDVSTGFGCSVPMLVTGLQQPSITWTSISPGATGAYNSFLSCTSACSTSIVTPSGTYPNFVDYQVCGTPDAGVCSAGLSFCDTVRVFLAQPLEINIAPNPAEFCADSNGVVITTAPNGGTPPYNYIWSHNGVVVGGGSSSFFATMPGTYSVEIQDGLYPTCPSTTASSTVVIYPAPLVDAGTAIPVCPGNPNIQLAGSFTNAAGATWSGAGSFSSTTDMNAVYTPTAAEISAGQATITLTSFGHPTCSPVTDVITVPISPPLEATIAAPALVCYQVPSSLTVNATGVILLIPIYGVTEKPPKPFLVSCPGRTLLR